MSFDEAMEFVRASVEPGMPSLGSWLGWTQPGEDEYVKLGSVTGRCRGFTLGEVLAGTGVGYLACADLFRMYGRHAEVEACFLVCDEVFLPFSVLDAGDQALYRLHTILINTMTLGHEWAIEWGDLMATMYFYHEKAHKSPWDHDGPGVVSDLLYYGVDLPVDTVDEVEVTMLKCSREALDYAYGYCPWDLPTWQRMEVARVLGWTLDWLEETRNQ